MPRPIAPPPIVQPVATDGAAPRRGEADDRLAHQAGWAAHVAAGRIGTGSGMTAAQVARLRETERLLGVGGRTAIW